MTVPTGIPNTSKAKTTGCCYTEPSMNIENGLIRQAILLAPGTMKAYLNFIVLLCTGLCLQACSDEPEGYTIKNPPALSLPQIKRDEADTAPRPQEHTVSLEVAEAIGRSSLVFTGKIQLVDSMIHGKRVPFYLIGAKPQQLWKGVLENNNLVYYISRRLPAHGRDMEQLFFLSPADSANVLAYSNKVRWQWTDNAPGILARDSSAYLVQGDSMQMGLKLAPQTN
jgi:hypothetical protein